MGVTKASVCYAIKLLKKKKLVQMDSNKRIYLTDEGGTLASEVYEKHKFFKRLLIDSGVCEGIASRDACRIEHAISDASFDKLKAYYNIINSTKQES
jgi:Mn-dependent DtxR family transcriptional regulator